MSYLLVKKVTNDDDRELFNKLSLLDVLMTPMEQGFR